MPRILDYTGREADRTVTVADIVALKEQGRRLAQVTASTPAEAAAAEAAGIEMVVCMSDFVPAVREGSRRVFVTAAVDFSGAVTEDDLRSMVANADMLGDEERRIVDDVFDAGDRSLREVMVPRTEVDFLPGDMSAYQAIRLVQGNQRSRYPVTDGSPDQVIGFLHVRENHAGLGDDEVAGRIDLTNAVEAFGGEDDFLLRQRAHHKASMAALGD